MPTSTHFSFPRATRLAVAALVLSWATAAQATPIDIDLPAQPLSESIKQLVGLSGLSIAADSALVAGKGAPAVKGRLEPIEALRQLLAGSGLVATSTGNSVVIGRGPGGVTLSEVRVTAQAEPERDGSAAAGYAADTLKSVGPWGEKSLLDTPYSKSVMSSDLIENVVAADSLQLFKMNPTVQMTTPNAALGGATTSFIRGFSNAIALDGMPTRFTANSSSVSLEDVEQVEIHSGPTTFLNDTPSVGGLVDFVLKRPTPTPLANLTVGNYGGEQYFVHADLGGPIDQERKFGYRLNLVTQDGDTAVDHQSLKRSLISGALDWHVTDKLLVQLNASRRDYEQQGASAYWNSIAKPFTYSNFVPDADRSFSQDFVVAKSRTDRYGIGTRWDINETFTLRANYQHNEVFTGPQFLARNTLNADGTYNQFVLKYALNRYVDQGGYVYLDSKFRIGPTEHKLVVGYAGNHYQSTAFSDMVGVASLNGLTFDNPYRPLPTFPTVGAGVQYLNNLSRRDGYKIGDTITFNDQWSALIGASYSRLLDRSMNPAGAVTNSYDQGKLTPTLSVLYKPMPWLTTYATYIEAFESGQLVGSSYSNSGAVLSPYVSKQYELGVKSDLNGLILTGSLFRLEKANSFEVPTTPLPTLTQDGVEIHQGMEFMAIGKLSSRWTVVGGLTVMDLRVEKATNPAIQGKKPTNVAGRLVKLYVEYASTFVPGLTLTGGAYYTGDSYQDSLNTNKIPGYTVADIGARYLTKWGGRETILRLNVTNVANRNFWASSFAVGEPRTVAFSATMKF